MPAIRRRTWRDSRASLGVQHHADVAIMAVGVLVGVEAGSNGRVGQGFRWDNIGRHALLTRSLV